ncbi:hypothetical protein L5F07_03990 [Aliarcobacter butzleri]|uniref:hypothetical protein n=1 Tax=Aliarcobacter butzleri TaxID=28197 RepID=UPI001EDA1987|nr:hypothetical protein [Aliarcobacter butzleri]MCG3678413.1 hypothetical protein [Aliarcobacter butzleri]
MKNTLKVIFLGIVGFGFLVYLTIPEKKVNKNENLTINSIPQYFDIVGNKSYSKIDTLFKLGEEKYIVVLNHDSLIVFKDLYKKIDKNNIVLVANISEAPWLVKKIAVNDELERMYKDSKIALITDSNGSFINSFGLNDNKQNRYFVYKLLANGTIEKISQGDVKENAMQNGISDPEIEKYLDEIIKVFK